MISRSRSYLVEAQVGPLSFKAGDMVRVKHDTMGLTAAGPFQVIRIVSGKVICRRGYSIKWNSDTESYKFDNKNGGGGEALASQIVITKGFV